MKRAVLTVSIAVCVGTLFIANGASAQQPVHSPTEETTRSLDAYLRTLAHDKNTYYVAAFIDLNGDGTPEAVTTRSLDAYLTHTGTSWKAIGNIPLTNPPIYVLPSTSNGWHDIAVQVHGGGIGGYEAQLRFNGKSYPRNPTIPPARHMAGEPRVNALISSARGAKPLYDGQSAPNARP